MKTIIKISSLLLMLAMVTRTQAQQIVTLCAGTSTVLTAVNSGGLSNPSYSLNPGGITSPNPTFAVSPSSNVTYVLYITGTNSNSMLESDSSQVTVQVASLPVAVISPTSQSIGCGAGVAAVTVTGTAVGQTTNVTHMWYAPGSPNPVVSGGATSFFAPTIVGSNGTNTLVLVDNVSGCFTSNLVYVTSAFAYPTFNLTSSQNYSIGCTSTSLTNVSISNAQTTGIPSGGAVSYTLLPPGYSGGPAYQTSTVSIYNITTPGNYTVIVKDNGDLCESHLPVSIIQNTLAPDISVSASSTTLSCAVPSVVLSGYSANSPATYLWSFQNGANTGYVIVQNLTVSINPATSSNSIMNTYSLQIVEANNQCISNTMITIYQNARPPIAMINSNPFSACTGTVYLFNTSTTGIQPYTFLVSQPVVGLLWEGPSPQVSASTSSSYAAYTSGVYTLTAMDLNNGCTSTNTTNVDVGPTAAFAHTITGGQVAFSNISTGTNANTIYYWDFGDGTTSTVENPDHTYLNGGAHLVKLKVVNPVCVDSVILSVNISGIPCWANSSFYMVPTSTAQVWDVTPGYPWNVTASVWNWGDGTSSNTLYTSHYYASAGLYSICLTVTVTCGDSSTTCSDYTIYRLTQQAMVVKINVIPPALIAGLASVSANEQLFWDILPNPNTGEFKLNLSNSKSESVRVVISDLTGRRVHDQLIESDLNATSIHTEGLPAGMYLVTLESGSLKATKRMIIHH